MHLPLSLLTWTFPHEKSASGTIPRLDWCLLADAFTCKGRSRDDVMDNVVTVDKSYKSLLPPDYGSTSERLPKAVEALAKPSLSIFSESSVGLTPQFTNIYSRDSSPCLRGTLMVNSLWVQLKSFFYCPDICLLIVFDLSSFLASVWTTSSPSSASIYEDLHLIPVNKYAAIAQWICRGI